MVTFPDPLAVVSAVKTALRINPKLKIVARVHRVREAESLKSLGVTELVSPEYEASLEFLRRILSVSGWKRPDIKQALAIVEQDQEIAHLKLQTMEISIDSLTDEQIKYKTAYNEGT